MKGGLYRHRPPPRIPTRLFLASLLAFVLVTGVKSNEHNDKDTASISNPTDFPPVDSSVGSAKGKQHAIVPPESLPPSPQQPNKPPKNDPISFGTDENDPSSGVEPSSEKEEEEAEDSDSASEVELSGEEEEGGEEVEEEGKTSSDTGKDLPGGKEALKGPSSTVTKPVTDKAGVSTQPQSKACDEVHPKTIQLRRSTGKDSSIALATIPEEPSGIEDKTGEGSDPPDTETGNQVVDDNGNALDKSRDHPDSPTSTANPPSQKGALKESHAKDVKRHSEPDYDTIVINPDTTHSTDSGDVRSLDSASGSTTSGPILYYPSHSGTTTKVHFADPGSSTTTTTTDASSHSPGTLPGDQDAPPAACPSPTAEPSNGLVAKYPSTDVPSGPTSDPKTTTPRDPIHTTPISPITIYNPLTSVDKRITKMSLYAVFGFCGACFVGLITSFIYTTYFGGATLLVVFNGVGSAIEGAASAASSSVSSVTTSVDSVMELGKSMFQAAAPTELATATMHTRSVEALTSISSVDVNQIDLI